FVAGAMAWNLSDFSSETREETMPHINNKGLLTLDRKPKDTYYLYKAKFGRKPFVKISNWTNRAIVSDGNTSVEQVTVLSNLEKLKLNVNGIVAEEKSVLDNIVSWSINLKKGINDISVEGLLNGEIYKDSAIIYLNTIPSTLKKYDFDKPLMVSFGDIRTYTDTLGNVWVPEREFSKGSWGFIGGQALFNDKSPRQKYGVDKNIFNTEDDPLYQTQRFGIKQLIFDVPRGTYQIDLLFADY